MSRQKNDITILAMNIIFTGHLVYNFFKTRFNYFNLE